MNFMPFESEPYQRAFADIEAENSSKLKRQFEMKIVYDRINRHAWQFNYCHC